MEQGNSSRGPAYRTALAAVILLSALLVAGVILLAVGFMRQYRIFSGEPAAARGAAPVVLSLAPGARILSVQTASGRLIVHVTGPDGGEAEVMDLATGRLLYRVKGAKP